MTHEACLALILEAHILAIAGGSEVTSTESTHGADERRRTTQKADDAGVCARGEGAGGGIGGAEAKWK